MNDHATVFIFQASRADFASAVFSSYEKAEIWIRTHQLNGTLTEYPMDYPIYDWAIDNGFFKVKSELQTSAKFIGHFSSAYQKHWHFIEGQTDQ